MMNFVFLIFAFLTLHAPVASAKCPASPSSDFSIEDKQYLETKVYSSLGTAQGKCLYFRDVSFKNGQGQQAVVIADVEGRCVEFFRTPLANGAKLLGTELQIKSAEGQLFKVNLSNGIPNKFLFDGEFTESEACLK